MQQNICNIFPLKTQQQKQILCVDTYYMSYVRIHIIRQTACFSLSLGDREEMSGINCIFLYDFPSFTGHLTECIDHMQQTI